MLIQCVNGLLKSPKNGVISSAFSSKLLEEKNKETEQMWHSNGLLWQKKKEKNERTQQLFLEACRKWQFGWLLIFLFFWGGLFFHSSGSRVSNLLCVRLIAIIIERVPGWTGSDWSRWRLRRASTALGKGKVLPCLVCCVLCGDGGAPPHLRTRGSTRAGLPGRSHVCPCGTSLTPSIQEKPLTACGTMVRPTDQTHRNNFINVIKWASTWNQIQSGPEPQWAVWPWADHLTSLSLSLHLPQWETELNTQQCEATSTGPASASPHEMVSCNIIHISNICVQEQAAGWGWTGEEFSSVSALLSYLHPTVVRSTATGAHLPAFNPTAAIDWLRTRYLTFHCLTSLLRKI